MSEALRSGSGATYFRDNFYVFARNYDRSGGHMRGVRGVIRRFGACLTRASGVSRPHAPQKVACCTTLLSIPSPSSTSEKRRQCWLPCSQGGPPAEQAALLDATWVGGGWAEFQTCSSPPLGACRPDAAHFRSSLYTVHLPLVPVAGARHTFAPILCQYPAFAGRGRSQHTGNLPDVWNQRRTSNRTRGVGAETRVKH